MEQYDLSIAHGSVDTKTTHRKYVSAGCHPYAEWHITRRQPMGSSFLKITLHMASQDGSFNDFLDNIVPILMFFSPKTTIL